MIHNAEEHHIFHLLPILPNLNKQLKEFYAFVAIRGFASGLIGIFIPIYVYLFFEQDLFPTFIFFALISASYAVFAPVGAKIISRIGLKHTILISAPFTFIYYVGLWNLDKVSSVVFLLAIFAGFGRALYWPAYHMLFTRFSDIGKRATETSYRTIILSIAAAISPIVGGIIVVQAGFAIVFVIVLALLFASVIPLFLSKEVFEEYEDSYAEAFKRIVSRKNLKITAAFGSQGIENMVQAIIWPIFIYSLAISFDSLGFITSASILIGMVYTYYIGKASDKTGLSRFLVIGALLNAAFWPLKFFVRGLWDAFFANSLHRFGRVAEGIPFGALFYEWAGKNKTSRDELVILRTLALNIFGALTLVVFAFVFKDVRNISYAFFVASFSALGYMFMGKYSKKNFSISAFLHPKEFDE